MIPVFKKGHSFKDQANAALTLSHLLTRLETEDQKLLQTLNPWLSDPLAHRLSELDVSFALRTGFRV